MHPRQMKRAPHQRLSTSDIRNFSRADLPSKPAATPQPSAFAAISHSCEVRIEVTRPFAVHFPFAGNVTLSFAAGEQAVPYAVGSWKPGSAMVVVAEWPLEERRLLAMPRSLSDRYDTVLGGFDLDTTGAVLAGSFWDCNLDDVEASNATTADPVATRMADFFVDRAKDGFDDTTQVDLVREGFAEREVMQHYEAAAGIAAEKLRDTELAADRVEYDRAARVMIGANAVAGLLLRDTGAVHTACRLAGLQTAEVGNLFDDIIGEAMRLVRQARPTATVQ